MTAVGIDPHLHCHWNSFCGVGNEMCQQMDDHNLPRVSSIPKNNASPTSCFTDYKYSSL